MGSEKRNFPKKKNTQILTRFLCELPQQRSDCSHLCLYRNLCSVRHSFSLISLISLFDCVCSSCDFICVAVWWFAFRFVHSFHACRAFAAIGSDRFPFVALTSNRKLRYCFRLHEWVRRCCTHIRCPNSFARCFCAF